MATHTNEVVPVYDFGAAETLTVAERFAQSLEMARSLVVTNGYQAISGFPCVPTKGADEVELSRLESSLRMELPTEYRQFLKACRYVKIDDGCEVGGLDHNGLYVTESPWISEDHRPGVRYLVFANYWRFADGDQLMFDLSDDSYPVIAYLHEHGPLYEAYASSFSLALWRLVYEKEEDASRVEGI